jgi:hypothetical protein
MGVPLLPALGRRGTFAGVQAKTLGSLIITCGNVERENLSKMWEAEQNSEATEKRPKEQLWLSWPLRKTGGL